MEKAKHIELVDLLGEHWLDAVDFNITKHKEWDGKFVDANSITFRLDGNCYTATEDPNDGYRSTMNEIFTKKVDMTNVFPPTWVVCRPYEADPDDTYNDHSNENGISLIEFVDAWNGKVILVVGTDYSDGYYPSFVSNWIPEEMAVNEGK
jgi:hypothetical protein